MLQGFLRVRQVRFTFGFCTPITIPTGAFGNDLLDHHLVPRAAFPTPDSPSVIPGFLATLGPRNDGMNCWRHNTSLARHAPAPGSSPCAPRTAGPAISATDIVLYGNETSRSHRLPGPAGVHNQKRRTMWERKRRTAPAKETRASANTSGPNPTWAARPPVKLRSLEGIRTERRKLFSSAGPEAWGANAPERDCDPTV